MKTLIWVAALITGLTAGKAFAACSPNYESPLTASVTLDDVDVTVGGAGSYMLTSKTYSSSNFAGLFGVRNHTQLATCDNSEHLILDVPYLDVNETGDGFKTGLDNVYFKFTNAANSLPSGGASEVIKTTNNSYRFLDVMSLNNSSQITFSMYATTGKLVSGETERILAWRLRTSDNTVLVEFYIEPVKVNVKACTVNPQDEVSFDGLTVKELKTPLATSGEETFAIKISCGLAYSPKIMFSGNTDSEYTNVFTNQSGEGYAQGVGVQLLRNNTIITPGEILKLTRTNMPTEFSSRVFSLAQTTAAGEIDIPVFFTIEYE